MNILIVYATNSGSTYSVAKIIADTLIKTHKVTLKLASQISEKDFHQFDAVVIGSPSWDYYGKEGYPHESVIDLINKFKGYTFPNKPFAVFGCGDSSYTVFCGAVDHLDKFVQDVKGMHLAKPLKIDGFFFDLDTNTQKVQAWAQLLASELKT